MIVPIAIRPYRPEDWRQIEQIHDAARKIELSLAGLPDAFLPLAVSRGVVCGFVAYTEDELAWLYVDPTHMRQGIGRSLVQYVIAHTEKRPLCIEVLKGNEPALRLYRSMGFETVETIRGHMPGNEAFPVCVYGMQHP